MPLDGTQSPQSILSPLAFLDWCREQPPKQGYEYASIHHCALALYLREVLGEHQRIAVGGSAATFLNQTHDIPTIIVRALAHSPHTFGALAHRLESIQ